MSDALRIVTPEDAALAKKPPVRVTEAEEWKDADSTKLVDLLEEIDGLKYEIHERMRRIEAVKQARSVLLEDAVRTEALNRKLHELGRAMGGVQAGHPEEKTPYREPEPMHVLQRDVVRESEPQVGGRVPLAEGQVPEPLKTTYKDLSVNPELTERVAARAESAREDGALAEEAEGMVGVHPGHVGLTPWNPNEDIAASTGSGGVDLAQSAAALEIAQEAFTAASEAARERVEEAERCWKLAEESAQEARRLYEESTAQLNLAISKEERYSADFEYAQQALTAGYKTAAVRLEEAERLGKQVDEAVQDSRKLLDQSLFELAQARGKEESATTDLLSARQELTTAYQFAAVAAQRRLDAEKLFLKTVRWAIVATAVSWIAMVWACWFSLRQWVPIWGPGIGMLVVLLVAVFVARRPSSES